MTIHVKVWRGSATARITDMANAGKRGKKCRVLRFSGAPWDRRSDNAVMQAAVEATLQALYYLEHLAEDATFETVRGSLSAAVVAAREVGVQDYAVSLYDEEIRGVDAPKPVLTAGMAGEWSAGADESGISLHDLRDVNEWTEITRNQTEAKAYAIAAKVWEQVRACRTLHEASDVLSRAGARLHGFCAMD